MRFLLSLMSVAIVLMFLAFVFGIVESSVGNCHTAQNLRTVCAPERLSK